MRAIFEATFLVREGEFVAWPAYLAVIGANLTERAPGAGGGNWHKSQTKPEEHGACFTVLEGRKSRSRRGGKIDEYQRTEAARARKRDPPENAISVQSK